MSKSKIIIILTVIVFIGIIVFLIRKTPDDKIFESKKENNIKAEQIEKEKQISGIKKALKRSLKPLDSEKIFNDQTGLEPLPFDEVEKLEGEALQKRYEELDVKLDFAINKNPRFAANSRMVYQRTRLC